MRVQSRLSSPQGRYASILWNMASVVCHSSSIQVEQLVVNIDVKSEKDPWNLSSGQLETEYEICEK